MKKIKLQIKSAKNQVVKIGKQKIEVVPFIATTDLMLVGDICIKKLEEDFENIQNSVILHNIFDMCLIEICTNIQVDGIKLKTEKGKRKNIEINLDVNKIAAFDIYNYRALLKNNIWNYEDAWKSVSEVANLFVIKKSLSNIASGLPNANDLEGTIKELGVTIKEMNERDPEMLKNIVQTAMENNAYVKAKDEIKTQRSAESTQSSIPAKKNSKK